MDSRTYLTHLVEIEATAKAKCKGAWRFRQMSAFEEDNLSHLTAAQGYVELGLFWDGDGELNSIEPRLRHLRKPTFLP